MDKQNGTTNSAGASEVSRFSRGEQQTLKAHWPTPEKGRKHALETIRGNAIPLGECRDHPTAGHLGVRKTSRGWPNSTIGRDCSEKWPNAYKDVLVAKRSRPERFSLDNSTSSSTCCAPTLSGLYHVPNKETLCFSCFSTLFASG